MTTLHVFFISLFTTGIIASTNCDAQINAIRKNAIQLRYPCGLPSGENCCLFTENHFDQSPSGVYKMNSWCSGLLSIVNMYCDTATANGGWTVIQRRKDGSENFDRPWADYERGFGDLNGEFWYGLKAMNCLTQTGQWELRVDFELENNTRSFLHYNVFRVGSASKEYPLTINGFTGDTPTDPFSTQQPLAGMKFTTYDNDNDRSGDNCAAKGHGGWWHRSCWNINLNYGYKSSKSGFLYLTMDNRFYNLKWIEMKTRPLNCTPH